MRIVHVIEPFASGIAEFVESLVENMKDDFHIIIHGERDDLITSAEVKKCFPENNVSFIHWKSVQREIRLQKDMAALVELCGILKDLKRQNMVDAVHLHSSKSGFLGRLACRLVHIDNVIYTPNGAPFLGSHNRFKNLLYKLFEIVGSSFGGRVVCCSSSELKAYTNIGIKAININNGISVKKIAPLQAMLQKNAKFRIVTSARVVNQKNPALFNEIATYFEGSDHIEFMWIGDGEERYRLSAKNIIITGWLPAIESRKLITSANLYLSTSDFEGLSFSVLEALALKKPVLLTNCVGNRDVVKKGLNGDLFESAKEAVLKIMQYLNNPEMLDVMGEYSMQYCNEKFNVHSTYTLYRNLYSGKG